MSAIPAVPGWVTTRERLGEWAAASADLCKNMADRMRLWVAVEDKAREFSAIERTSA